MTVFSCVIIFVNKDVGDLWLQLRHTLPSPQICPCLYYELNTPETSSKWGFCCRKEWKMGFGSIQLPFFHNE